MKKFLFLFSIVFVIVILGTRWYINNKLIFKQPTISQNEYDTIISTKKEYSDFIELKYNNETIPFDKINNYYLLSQIENTSFSGYITIDNFTIKVLENNKSKNELIKSNTPLTLLAYNNKYYKVINLYLTYFPIVCLNNSTNKVTIYDNDSERQALNIQSYFMSYHKRGATSSSSIKPPYKLNILDSKGNKKKISLLNMRTDDDWILNSMTMDKSYMIEKIGYHIWSKLSEYDIELKYIELFIDNEYKGIYCLQEPADFKTYNANKKSMLVSIKYWKENITNPILFNEDLKYNYIIDEFELDSKLNNEIQLDLLRNFASDIKKIPYSSNLILNYNVQNLVDYSLFINLISAIDNTYKNQKVLFRYVDGSYFVELYPWDLDWSQNNEILINEYSFNDILTNKSIPKEILKDNKYQNAVVSRYNFIKNTIYKEEYLYSYIDSNKEILINSGAILREQNVYGERDLQKSSQNLKDFYKKRIETLDYYYGGK